MKKPPALLVCMGVSGSGKSTVARALAQRFGLEFCEADDYHGPENKAHMAAGRPLNDAMREPWVDRLSAALETRQRAGRSCALAWSGLRRAQRQRIRTLGFRVLFLHLQAEEGAIADRLASRRGHFFDPGLLRSQFEDLQPTQNEQDVMSLDVSGDLEEVLAAAEEAVRVFLQSATGGHSPP